MRLVAIFVLFWFAFLKAEVITRLPASEKVVAIAMDACETKTPSYIDWKIVNYLLENRIPFTLFVNGKFLLRNWKELEALHRTGLVSIQNHSMNHHQHMERPGSDTVVQDVLEAEKLIQKLTGRRPAYFRFPGGQLRPENAPDSRIHGL